MYPFRPYNRRESSIKMIVVGSIFLVYALVILSDIWPRTSGFYIYRGTARSADCFVIAKTYENKRGWSRTTNYNQADLIIKLYEVNNAFMISEHIGTDTRYEPFIKLKNKIGINDSLFIGIDVNDRSAFTPRVMQIKNSNGETLYSVTDATSKSRITFVLTGGIGIIFLGLGILYFLPLSVKRKIGL